MSQETCLRTEADQSFEEKDAARRYGLICRTYRPRSFPEYVALTPPFLAKRGLFSLAADGAERRKRRPPRKDFGFGRTLGVETERFVLARNKKKRGVGRT